MLKDGFTYKLIIGDNGQVWSEGKDPQGKDVVSQDLDAVTILDKFVREHPDFSPYGAKGCLSLTGYQGILGYRTMTVEGAKKALEAGAAGIVVSNHGGRVLDQCPATAEVLPAIADAVGGRMTILVDGGIRTGMWTSTVLVSPVKA